MFKSMKVRIGLASRPHPSLRRHHRSRPGADPPHPVCPPRPDRPGTAEPLANRAHRQLASGMDSAGAVGDSLVMVPKALLRCAAQVKFGGGRSKTSPPTPGSASENPPPPPQQNNTRVPPLAPAASLPSRSTSGNAPPRPQNVVSRDKPPLPVLTPENAAAVYAEPLPSFRDVTPADKQLLFVKKLHLCSFTFDFTDQARAYCHKQLQPRTFACVCFPRPSSPSLPARAYLVAWRPSVVDHPTSRTLLLSARPASHMPWQH